MNNETVIIFVIPSCGHDGFEINSKDILTTHDNLSKAICPECKKEVYID